MTDVYNPNHTTRFPFANVDLSLIPAPMVLKDYTYEKILAERLKELEALFVRWGIPFNVGSLETDPSAIHQEEDAYREMLNVLQINDAATANMVAYARGSDLDNLAALVGLRRLVIKHGDPTASPPIPDVMQPDEELRALMRVALDGTAIGLTGGSYKLIAQQAAPEVRDVGVIRTSPGHLTIVLLGRGNDRMVSDDIVRKVNDAIQADKGAQLTDIVSVRSAAGTYYDIVVNAVIPPGPSKQDIEAASVKALRECADRLAVIGGEVRTSALIAAGRVPAMTRFDLIKPTAHIHESLYHVPVARNITVNLTVEVI